MSYYIKVSEFIFKLIKQLCICGSQIRIVTNILNELGANPATKSD
jgi:hypothetical protein